VGCLPGEFQESGKKSNKDWNLAMAEPSLFILTLSHEGGFIISLVMDEETTAQSN
jgi:hypothetical protein